MDEKLTREQVDELRALLHEAIYEDSVKWNTWFKGEVLHGLQTLCDLALSALSPTRDRDDQQAARISALENALEGAAEALYNGFEPDNQSRAYHAARTALARSKAE